MKNILVVESETALAESIKSRFEAREEFAVDIVPSGYGALSRLGAAVPDGLVLATALPDLSGWDVCMRRAVAVTDRISADDPDRRAVERGRSRQCA